MHLIQAELLDELAAVGLTVAPGDMGENVTTRGLDLLALPTGTRLGLGTPHGWRSRGCGTPACSSTASDPV